MFGNTKRIKELEEDMERLKEDIYRMKIAHTEELQNIRSKLYKKENYAWELQREEIELIEKGKKVKKIIEMLK